ncbi:MAG: SpoIID/LytB domain-containing protein [Candidatus Saccharicenans sp.]|nr:SpoIID/LytB domain-containing protein [Candidatus Saccharicenans sp.]
MKKIRALKYFMAAFLALFFIAGKPPEFGRESNFFQGYVIPRPVVRVGLLVGMKQAVISSSSGMKIYEIGREYRLLAEDAEEVVIKVEKEKLTEKFVLLITQTSDYQEAELLAAELSQKLPGQVLVEEKIEAGTKLYQLKYGEFLTRGQALESIRLLETLGYREVWIIREIVSLPEPGNIWLQVDHKLQSFNKEADLYFIPAFPESFLRLNGRSYRGIFQLKNTGRGLALINILNLEDYLKGVVPLEMSPGTFNALEALKAQAVAARTYALKNLGGYKALGFDLTDTQSSQVYGGLSAEHPLSNRAVEETAGEVITYKNELINALYTSTCGGMTEDAEKIFSGRPVPYLKSVSCSHEKQPEWRLETSRAYPGIRIRERDVLAEVFPLLAAGIITHHSSSDYFDQPVSGEEAASALHRVNEFKQINNPAATPGLGKLSRINFVELAHGLVEFFGWQEKTDLLLLPAEVDFLLNGHQRNKELKEADRKALAYLLQSGIYPSYLRDDNLFRPVTRAELAFILKKSLSWLEDLYHQGTFLGKKGDQLEVMEDNSRRLLPWPADSYLLRSLEEGVFPARSLILLGGEKIRWIEADGRVKLLEVIYPSNTNLLDRSSRYNRWNVRVSRQELEKNILKSYPQVGPLTGLKVLQRGKSNRVIELQVIGEKGTVVVQGLRVRWVLNLKDTLFSIDREYDHSGRLSHFVFSGRGWGHGVGLCQVGAYGMALAGADYKEIVSHYYKNTKIEKIH